MSRPLRVVHLPAAVGNNAAVLSRAEREIGIDSRAISLHPSPFAYDGIEVLFAPDDGPLRKEWKRWRLLRSLLQDADVVHCNFGRCLMPVFDPSPPANRSLRYEAHAALCRLLERVDLRLLRRSGKGIVVTYQGDDARQSDYCLAHFERSVAHGVEPGYYSPRTDARKRRRIEVFDRYAHRIYALNPDLLHVLPERAEFLPYASIDPRAWRPVGVDLDPSPLRVLHAPSHRGAKGSAMILETIHRLQAEGVPLELLLVEGLLHHEARRRYEEADVLVDQMLAGFYGGLAVELMALAKPVVAYLREPDLVHLPAGMRADLPVVNAGPDELADTLRRLAKTPRADLAELGSRSRAFAERWHDPQRIAQQLLPVYQDALREAGQSR